MLVRLVNKFQLIVPTLELDGVEVLWVPIEVDAGYMMNAGVPYYAGVAAAACHYSWQLTDVDLGSRQDCLAKFVSNKWFGALVFTGIVADKLVTQAPSVIDLC